MVPMKVGGLDHKHESGTLESGAIQVVEYCL